MFDDIVDRIQAVLPKLDQVFKKDRAFLTDLLDFFELVIGDQLGHDFLPYTLFTDAVALSAANNRGCSSRKPTKETITFFGW